MNTHLKGDKAREKKIYVCQSGLPLSFHLEWPFHKSTSGADFWVLHADIALENSQGLHAPVSVKFSSRYYDFKRSKWVFGKATDEAIALLIARKVYWQTKVAGGPVWAGDPTEPLFVENSVEHILEIAQKVKSQELMTLEGEWASANASLMAQSEKFEADMRAAVAELEQKHAYERG